MNKRWIALGVATGLVVLGILFWIGHAAGRAHKNMQEQWQEKIQHARVLTNNGALIPSAPLLRTLEQCRLTCTEKIKILLTVLKQSQTIPEYENSLAFKGDLFKVQHALLARADAMSIGIPGDIGFKEFTGKEIPPSSELEELSFQLSKIKSFVELLMDCPVSEIAQIRRGAIHQRRMEPDEEIPFYQDFSFGVHFFCTAQAFKKFVTLLVRCGSVFILENLEVRLRSENALEVQADIRAVSFQSRFPDAVDTGDAPSPAGEGPVRDARGAAS